MRKKLQSPPALTSHRKLPSDLNLPGDLDFRDCTGLRKLGENTVIGGSLWIGGHSEKGSKHRSRTMLSELPNGLAIGGHFTLVSASLISELPESLTVRGNTNLCGLPKLRIIPPGVLMGSVLEITGCPELRSLPAGLTELKRLILDGVGIASLPEDLVMADDAELVLRNCAHLTFLTPQLLKGKRLRLIRIQNCPQLTALPQNLEAKRIYLTRLPIEISGHNFTANSLRIHEWRGLLKMTGDLNVGNLMITRCPLLQEVGPCLRPMSQASFRECSTLAALPKNLQFASNEPRVIPQLDVRGCKEMECLPQGLIVLTAHPANSLIVSLEGSGITKDPGYSFPWAISYRGARIRPRLIFRTHELEPHEILLHENAEVRRLLVQLRGIDSLKEKCHCRLINEDTDAGGPRKLIELELLVPDDPLWNPRSQTPTARVYRHQQTFLGWLWSHIRKPSPPPQPLPPQASEPTDPATGRRKRRVRFLQCQCPSTGREYLLSVPLTVTTAHGAAAWMAGFDNPSDYHPETET